MTASNPPIPIIAWGGDALCAPQHTLNSLWSALGAGADGLALPIALTKDRFVVVHGSTDGLDTELNLAELTLKELQEVDAGASFRSKVLNSKQGTVDKRGSSAPWKEHPNKRDRLVFPTLESVFVSFSRRAPLYIVLPDHDANMDALIEGSLRLIRQFGLQSRIGVIGIQEWSRSFKNEIPELSYIATLESEKGDLKSLADSKIHMCCVPIESLISNDNGSEFKGDFINEMKAYDITALVYSQTQPYGFSKLGYDALLDQTWVKGILTRGVLPTVELGRPKSLIVSNAFTGDTIDRALWSAGYSQNNTETTIRQQNGLIIQIEEGQEYSGGGLVSVIPFYGDFDARVEFSVSHPQKGTTFELAAISVDAPYFHIDHNPLSQRNVNLGFDVHGVPPYASSEFDENDGYRCGWNNGFSLARFNENGRAQSVNMHNKYGRNVGEAIEGKNSGELRLIRKGTLFNSYYKDTENGAWVCSGTMLVPNLCQDVHIRLAAKHWSKRGKTPPANTVIFRNFQLFQY